MYVEIYLPQFGSWPHPELIYVSAMAKWIYFDTVKFLNSNQKDIAWL